MRPFDSLSQRAGAAPFARLRAALPLLAIMLLSAASVGCNAPDDLHICECNADGWERLPVSRKAFCTKDDNAQCSSLCSTGGITVAVHQNNCTAGAKFKIRMLLEKIGVMKVEVAEFKLAQMSPDAPYSGALVESGSELSQMRIRKGSGAWSTWVPVRGNVSLDGELCPYGSCAIGIEWLRAEAKSSFSFSGDSVTRMSIINHGAWSGVKQNDDTYYFHQSSALQIAGRVNGTDVAVAGIATTANGSERNIIQGRMIWPVGQRPVMGINGSFTDGQYTVEVDLAFNLNNAAPEARAQRSGPGTACPNATFEGSAFSQLYPQSQLSLRWLDRDNRVIGTGTCLTIPNCAAGRGPVALEVRDPAGRITYAQPNGDPVLGVPRADERFGQSVASGDFNNDGYEDVVVGAPYDLLDGYSGPEQDLCGEVRCNPDDWNGCEPSVVRAGAIVVLFGSPHGLTAENNQFLSQYTTPTWGTEELNDQLGRSVAVGDFNADGYADIATGVPGENHPGGTSDGGQEGAVNVFYGSPGGLKPSSRATDGREHRGFYQGADSVPDSHEANDQFGFSLAAGDFNRDGASDLAVGVPGEDNYAGAVVVLLGQSGQGLRGSGSRIIRQSSTISSASEPQDFFGYSLAAGDVNNDGYADLAIGHPGEDGYAGAATLLYGGTSGPRVDSSRWTLRPTDGRTGFFGWSMAIGEITGDLYGDMVVGSPSAAVNGVSNVGVISGFRGASTGLGYGIEILAPGGPSGYGTIPGPMPSGSNFGYAVAVGKFDGDEIEDIAVSAPNYSTADLSQTGLGVLLLSASGTTWLSDHDGTNWNAEQYDNFGFSMAMADVDNNGRKDVVFGVPGQRGRSASITSAGATRVLMAPDHRGQGSRIASFTQDTKTAQPIRQYRWPILE